MPFFCSWGGPSADVDTNNFFSLSDASISVLELTFFFFVDSQIQISGLDVRYLCKLLDHVTVRASDQQWKPKRQENSH